MALMLCFFHQPEVGEHVFLGDVMTGELIVFVDVDPFELDRHAIDEEAVADNFQRETIPVKILRN